MKPDETQFGTMLHALQERAKELNCLYQVGELLSQSGRPLEEIFRDIIEVLPPGWQYPHDCQARILFENLIIQPQDFQETCRVRRLERSKFLIGESCRDPTKALFSRKSGS